MTSLYSIISTNVDTWRKAGYPCEEYPLISEILEWCYEPETGTSRFLRKPQIRALETYWYLRLVEKTPHIFDLYKKYYQKTPQLLNELGLDNQNIKDFVLDEGKEALWNRIKTDDIFVRDYKLEALRETLTLDYPSYIFALAMGAGKTILIGAIIASEYAMAMEYPNGSFIQNALVFAPGNTIIESLRELSVIPYNAILPPRMNNNFIASVKLTFTRTGEKDVPVIPQSSFNIVVTNTEKIRIQKETIRKMDLGSFISPDKEDEAKREIANLRLQKIASLPHLGIFSDEAHHTYGQSMTDGLKKVRLTVDYLSQNTNLVCVINTTGTPYYQRQPLKDVVIWYGLAEGIKDGILKDLAGNIQAFDFQGDAKDYVSHVVEDFFKTYDQVRLPNGSPAKIAIYFPQTSDLKELKPVIDNALIKIGQSPTICLINTSDDKITKKADIDAFNKLNDPTSTYRVILLVNKGTEGWNCPSLFACALARKLKTSNNFVLQASTRCLRQIPGNLVKARVYLSSDNYSILDRQLSETYGSSIVELNRASHDINRAKIILKKIDLPPLVITQIIRTVIKKDGPQKTITLQRPQGSAKKSLEKRIYTIGEQESTYSVLRQIGETIKIESAEQEYSSYEAAIELSAIYRVPFWTIYQELTKNYALTAIPSSDLGLLGRQIESLISHYEVKEERIDVALALVKPDGFNREIDSSGSEIFTADIIYPKDREHLLLSYESLKEGNIGNFGFHYSPYNFDSNPEKSFFEQMLLNLNVDPDDIEDIYFTGALTDPAKTDFSIGYKDDKGKWRNYTPDFLIRKKPEKGKKPGTGKVIIVEIKAERERDHRIDGENGKKALAIRKWEKLNPERLRYQMIFTSTDIVTSDQMKGIQQFIDSS